MNIRKDFIWYFIVIQTIIMIHMYYILRRPTFSSNEKTTNSLPFFAIWCDIEHWNNYLSDEFYTLWKELEDVYGWKIVADFRLQNRTWLKHDTITSYYNRYFNRIPDLIL